MLELVAARELSFFHQVGAKLGKRNGQFTEKPAMSFSMCYAAPELFRYVNYFVQLIKVWQILRFDSELASLFDFRFC